MVDSGIRTALPTVQWLFLTLEIYAVFCSCSRSWTTLLQTSATSISSTQLTVSTHGLLRHSGSTTLVARSPPRKTEGWAGSGWAVRGNQPLRDWVEWEAGVAFSGSGTWESVCRGRDVRLKSYDNFIIYLFFEECGVLQWYFLKEEKRKRSMHFGVQLKPGTPSFIITGSFGFFPPGRVLLPISFKIWGSPPSRFCSGSRSCADGAVWVLWVLLVLIPPHCK